MRSVQRAIDPGIRDQSTPKFAHVIRLGSDISGTRSSTVAESSLDIAEADALAQALQVTAEELLADGREFVTDAPTERIRLALNEFETQKPI